MKLQDMLKSSPPISSFSYAKFESITKALWEIWTKIIVLDIEEKARA